MEPLRTVTERINHRAGYVERRVYDTERGAVRIVKEPLETALPALANRTFKCRACEDRGMVQVPFEYQHGDRLIFTTTRAVCHCPAGSRLAEYRDDRLGLRYMTVRELTGSWVSVEMHARAEPAPPPKVPMQRVERPDGSAVWEQDLSDLDNDELDF